MKVNKSKRVQFYWNTQREESLINIWRYKSKNMEHTDRSKVVGEALSFYDKHLNENTK